MLDENAQARVNQAYTQIFIIWSGMLGAVILYGALSYFSTQSKSPHFAPSVSMMRPILLVAALSSVCAAHFIKQMVLQRVLSQNTSSLAIIITTFTTACQVSFGLSESAALYGLFLVFMTNSMKEIFPFAGISLAGFLLYLPQKTQLESLIAEKWDRKNQ